MDLNSQQQDVHLLHYWNVIRKRWKIAFAISGGMASLAGCLLVTLLPSNTPAVTFAPEESVNDYLRGRAVLKRALVLVDSRHGLKRPDREMMEMLDDAAVSYHLVLTKADKIKARELDAVTRKTAAEARTHVAAHPEILITSSEKGLGIPELRAAVLEAIG